LSAQSRERALSVRRETGLLRSRTAGSARAFESAARSIAGGVCSTTHAGAPAPIHLVRGKGTRVWDVDDREYLDLHAGHGSLVVGHAHPAVVRAIKSSAECGLCFAAPSPSATPVAEELRERFRLPLWRFTNSGTEATMAAVRVARAVTSRDVVVKFEGAYHGHHDAALVSVSPTREEAGRRSRPRSVAASGGLPASGVALTRSVPYNDVDGLVRVFADAGADIACVIVEVPLLNPTLIFPDIAFLNAIERLCREHGALLILDEVKTGVVLARGGSRELYSLDPDLIALGKSLAGGLPCGAIGGRVEIMEEVARGAVPMNGTFNGNPVTTAVMRTVLQLLDDEAYERLSYLGARACRALQAIIDSSGIPAAVASIGPRGCITMTAGAPRDYRDWLDRDRVMTELFWLHQVNRGVYPSPTPTGKWMFTLAHSELDVDTFVANFDGFWAEAVRLGLCEPAGARRRPS
jgi:glutamate-1-semialdehyde 2,1-aminomutase